MGNTCYEDPAHVEEFGAVGDGVADDYDALNAAFNREIAPGRAGTIILSDAKTYFCSKTLNLKKVVRIQGTGGGNLANFASARIIFPEGVQGIVVNRHDTIGDTVEEVSTGRADGSVIEGIALIGGGGNNTANGIRLRARAVVKEVRVHGFSQDGINVVADARTSDESRVGNANGFSISNVRITGCGRHGMLTDGGDVNAGETRKVDASHNGGWGIYDSSFLGNTYSACHTSINALGPYKTDNNNARNVLVGCYSEGNQPKAQLTAPTVVVGGLHGAGIEGSAFIIQAGTTGGELSAFSVRSTPNSERKFKTYFSRLPGESISLVADGDHSRGLSLSWEESSKQWVWRHARLNNRTSMGITTNLSQLTYGRNNPVRPGSPNFPMGLWIGSGNNGRFLGYADAPPTSGEHAQGDILFNRSAVIGDFAGWICFEGGDPGLWGGFGRIEELQ